VTEASMRQDYQGFELVAHDGDPAHGFRWVTPYGGGASCMIRARLYQDDRNEMPPLAFRKLPESRPRHPIDELFENDPKTFRTLRRETIDGHATVLIEQRTDAVVWPAGSAKGPPAGSAGSVEQFNVTRAWIDPERGGLPLKIEWSYDLRKDGQPQPGSGKPYKVLEVTEIADLGEGRFYPTRGAIRTYGLNPVEAAKQAADKSFDAEALVPYEETTWHANKVEADLAPNESLSLPFPKGTPYYDEMTGFSMRSGEEGYNASRLPWTLCGAIAAGWALYGLYAAGRAIAGRRRLASAA
jgi:hypothetical protein